MALQTTIVEPIMFGFMFCLFATYPVEQQLVYKKFCNQKFNSSYCEILYKSKNVSYQTDQNVLQKGTANWEIYFNIARSLPSIVATLLCGLWSDRLGRKTFMLFPIIGNSLLMISLITNSHYFNAPIPYMLIGTFISAMFGGFAMILSTLFSYVADVTSTSSRTKRTLILESMVSLGSVLSNLSAGFILQEYGFTTVLVTILCIYCLQIVYWFFIKESCSGGGHKKFAETCSWTSVYSIVRIFTRKRPNRFRMTIWLLVGCFFCIACFFIGLNQFIVLYVLHQPFNFSSSLIGYFLAEFNAIKFIGATLINYFLLHRLKWHDNWMIVVCGLAYAGFAFCCGFSKTTMQIFLSSIWASGLGVGNGAVRGRLSKLVSPSEQGKMFAFLACFEVVISLFSGVMFDAIYKSTVSISASISFYFLGSLPMIPITLAFVLMRYGEKGNYVSLQNDPDDEKTRSEVNS